MKTYKTWEVIKMLEENPKLKFECREVNLSARINCQGNIYLDCRFGSNTEINGNFQLNGEWQLVQQPVTFMEAVNSGKKIRYEIWGYSSTLKNALETIYRNCESIQRRMLNGNWYVEEEE